jgi:hypothetical protein
MWLIVVEPEACRGPVEISDEQTLTQFSIGKVRGAN